VHESRPQPRQQLALPEHDRGLVPQAPRAVPSALQRRRVCQEPREEARAPREEQRAGEDRDAQRGGGGRRRYRAALALRIASLIAGTTSCRSPITA
jgi:hypothetical protein